MKSDFVLITAEIKMLVSIWRPLLLSIDTEVVSRKFLPKDRNIKQVIGHLIDSAVNNHHRFVRLQYNDHLEFPDYRQDNEKWISIQNYESEDFELLVCLWVAYNRHLCHIIKNINSQALNNSWCDCDGKRETLETVVKGYLWHLNLHLGEIEQALNKNKICCFQAHFIKI